MPTKKRKFKRTKQERKYLNRFMIDHQTLATSDFIFARFEPTALHTNTWAGSCGASYPNHLVRSGAGDRAVALATARCNKTCLPVLCKIKMHEMPQKSSGLARSDVRDPAGNYFVCLQEDVIGHYLVHPLVDPNAVFAHEIETHLTQWCQNNKNVVRFRIPSHVPIHIYPPMQGFDRCRWEANLRSEHFLNPTDDPSVRMMSDDGVEIGHDAIGTLTLLTEETRRYASLLQIDFSHVTTVPDLWTLIVEYQVQLLRV